ncbi:DUF6731 family protein [Rhodoferax sp. BLA1]|uniref:DUF6731 family protein n=1 Tax=Rhodoferax sp. BLA1 TaxID=2576062 RepID=UPI0015D36926|nr:DUF6731 family protein [Rhodoferax sp. BLA1]
MAKQVTVNIFDVEWDERTTVQKLSDTLDEFKLLPLEKRWRDDVRLEHIEVGEFDGTRLYKLDFVKRRDIGPGRLASGSPIKAIQMAMDEDFGEETAAIYVPHKKWLLVLHNVAGVGPSRMMAYCNALDPGNADRHFNYAANPKLDPAVMKRLKGMTGISSIDVTATMDAFQDADADSGMDIARATRVAKPKRISLQLMANESRKRGSFLENVRIKKFIDGMLRHGEDVTKLQVSGESPEADGKDLVIDLLHHKVKRKFSADELDVVEHRYTRKSRLGLLERSYHGWRNTL